MTLNDDICKSIKATLALNQHRNNVNNMDIHGPKSVFDIKTINRTNDNIIKKLKQLGCDTSYLWSSKNEIRAIGGKKKKPTKKPTKKSTKKVSK